MLASTQLKRRVGEPQYRQLRAHSNPRNEEQWAFAVLASLQQQDRQKADKHKQRRHVLEEIKRIVTEHVILGTEDEDQLQEWANVLPKD